MDKIGEYIKGRIKQAGYSLAEVATLLEMSPQNLNNRLGAKDVSVVLVIKIASVIKKSVEYLIENAPNSAEKIAGNTAGNVAPNVPNTDDLTKHNPQNDPQMLVEIAYLKDELIRTLKGENEALKDQNAMLKEALKKESHPGIGEADSGTEARPGGAASR